MAHLDDGGSPFAREVALTMPRPFNAVSFDLWGSEEFEAYLLRAIDDAETCEPVRHDNVLVTGLRGGAVVARAGYASTATSGPVGLGSRFAGLDALVFGFGPSPLEMGPPPEGYDYHCPAGSPCSHYSIDDVVLAPVPLPASIGLSGIGLAALALLRRRRPAPGGR